MTSPYVGDPWSADELNILRNGLSEGLTPREIWKAVSAAGFDRTFSAVETKVYLLRAEVKAAAEDTSFQRMDDAFCRAMRRAGYRQTGPVKASDAGVPVNIPRAIRSLGSGWQIETGGQS